MRVRTTNMTSRALPASLACQFEWAIFEGWLKFTYRFTISIQEITDNSAVINVFWSTTRVTLDLGVEVDERVMANIESVLAGPSGGDYYNAASYYHSSGKDLAQALEWINKATDVAEPKFWQVRRKALILADMGKKKEAIKTAKMSMELAMKWSAS